MDQKFVKIPDTLKMLKILLKNQFNINQKKTNQCFFIQKNKFFILESIYQTKDFLKMRH